MDQQYRRLYTAEQIGTRIEELAAELVRDYEGTTTLFVTLLRGAMPFTSKLMFAIARHAPTFHPDLDYMMVRTYGHERVAREPIIVTDLAPSTEVTGRDIIILDDVIDLGVTSEFVKSTLLARGARTVKVAVLGSKTVPGRAHDADYVGFECGDKWLVGMGLDDAKSGPEHYRWLDEIWEIPHD